METTLNKKMEELVHEMGKQMENLRSSLSKQLEKQESKENIVAVEEKMTKLVETMEKTEDGQSCSQGLCTGCSNSETTRGQN